MCCVCTVRLFVVGRDIRNYDHFTWPFAEWNPLGMTVANEIECVVKFEVCTAFVPSCHGCTIRVCPHDCEHTGTHREHTERIEPCHLVHALLGVHLASNTIFAPPLSSMFATSACH